MRAPWIFSDLDCSITRHGPLMGQDTADVLHRVLDLSSAEIADLEGVLQ
jgi:crotonobetainyl-CoA:carnitine CoA-transferase CaiB-like acyl-CoA transferase